MVEQGLASHFVELLLAEGYVRNETKPHELTNPGDPELGAYCNPQSEEVKLTRKTKDQLLERYRIDPSPLAEGEEPFWRNQAERYLENLASIIQALPEMG